YYRSAISGARLPAAVLDLDALDTNAEAVRARAGKLPVRLGSKSIRVRGVLERLLASNARYAGLLCFSADEAVWLSGHGFTDLVVAYPTVQEEAVRRVCAVNRELDGPITLMVDSVEHVERLGRIAEQEGVRLPLCLDLDLSVRFPGLFFGVRRSPIADAKAALAVFRATQRYPSLTIDGVMGYEAQIAGLPDSVPGARLKSAVIRALKRASIPKIHASRQTVVSALREAGAELRFVNGGGTGSLESTARDEAVTELTAGSAFFAPLSFDWFEGFSQTPAMLFALEAARVPATGFVTCSGGGYIASGAAGADRLPRPVLPEGLSVTPSEGAGEVQTPLRLHKAARGATVPVGEPVFFRHTKAGELCERFDEVLCVRDGSIVERMPTYRGEGRCFL
ncbi:MAG: alanine racemase, partial [Spirochaetaceae bacterium]